MIREIKCSLVMVNRLHTRGQDSTWRPIRERQRSLWVKVLRVSREVSGNPRANEKLKWYELPNSVDQLRFSQVEEPDEDGVHKSNKRECSRSNWSSTWKCDAKEMLEKAMAYSEARKTLSEAWNIICNKPEFPTHQTLNSFQSDRRANISSSVWRRKGKKE